MEKEEYEKLYQLEESHWWYRGLRELILSSLPKSAPSSLRFLDAGCGTGGLLKALQSHYTALGMDAENEALSMCKKRGLPLLVQGSIADMPFGAATFDYVVSLDVLYHSNVSDDQKALREFHRVLRDSGKLILNLPAYSFLRSAHDQAIHTQRRYTREDLRKKLTACGFQPQRITYRNFFLLPPVLIWRIARNHFRKSNHNSDLFQTTAILNRALLQLLRTENLMMKWINFPFGSSVFCIAGKL